MVDGAVCPERLAGTWELIARAGVARVGEMEVTCFRLVSASVLASGGSDE